VRIGVPGTDGDSSSNIEGANVGVPVDKSVGGGEPAVGIGEAATAPVGESVVDEGIGVDKGVVGTAVPEVVGAEVREPTVGIGEAATVPVGESVVNKGGVIGEDIAVVGAAVPIVIGIAEGFGDDTEGAS
jgi:hypothetical protein